MPDIPSHDDLCAYMAGRLAPSRFTAVDAWLASLSDAETEQVLSGIDERGPNLSGLLMVAPPQPGFQAVRGSSRAVEGVRLGGGGMAEVLSAHDRVLDRTIALKVLKARQPNEDLGAYHLRETSFHREAALTAALDHPAIPPVYDIGKVDGRPAFTMKRLAGASLFAIVEAGKMPLIELIQALTRVAEAVAFAHAHRIIHRDLSPNNILIGDYGAVYVVDWGVAARVGAEAGVRAGTPAWMAPEQHRAAAADPRMDVWALGALLHFVIAGYGPHAVPASGPFAWERRAVPRGLSALMRRCLDPDPARRYHDACAVAGELHRWLDQGLTLAQGAGRITVAWLRLRHSPRLRTALLAACFVTLIAGGIGLWSHRAARARAEVRLIEIANGVPLDRPEAMAVAIDELTTLRAAWPTLTSAAALESRLQTARDVAEANERSAQFKERLNRLLVRTRQLGPWTDQARPVCQVDRAEPLARHRRDTVHVLQAASSGDRPRSRRYTS